MLASPMPSPEGAVDTADAAVRARAARRNRFVTACQQLLALGLVLAALTPAARTITMDVRPASPQDARTHHGAALRSATVPTTAVDPDVEEYSLTAPEGARLAPGALRASSRRTATGGQELTSDAVPVNGYGAVGVTWEHGLEVADDALAVEVRTFQDGAWSDWTDVPYHDDHGPDPDSDEARHARPGTEPLLVGEVDEVQVRIATDSSAPADMKLAVIDPGEAASTTREKPAIDTDTLDGDADSTTETSEGELGLRAAVTAPKPKIFSRAQWGADERMRDAPSLHYYEVHAGFVHHTVNANGYTREQVPSIIRGIYAYHTQSQGWSDIGYNFLVDRFGRVWEGRYGGVDRPVVGAHTLGYNDNAFAASAIGNFETARPSRRMIRAYGRLFAWKLSLHGVGAADTKQYVTSRYFKAINGHRDAGATACPGINLYNRIPRIRELAAAAQQGWGGRELESSVVASARPDLVLRRAVDGKVFLRQIVPTDTGGYRLGKRVPTGLLLPNADRIIKAGDWDLDGYGDLIVKNDGVLTLYRGIGKGKFAAPTRLATGFDRVTKLAAVGDFTGDGRPDLMGQPARGSMRIYPGAGTSGLRASYTAYSPIRGRNQLPIGRWDRDGAPDSLIRTRSGLVMYYGNGPGGFTRQKSMALPIAGYDWLIGVDDVDLTGHSDLIARTASSGQLWVIPGRAGGFRTPVAVAGDTQEYDMVG